MNPNTETRIQQIKETIEREMQKSDGELNIDLIQQSLSELRALDASFAQKTDEEIELAYDRFCKRYMTEKTSDVSPTKRRHRFRRLFSIGIVAAMLAAFSAATFATGEKAFQNEHETYMEMALALASGQSITANGITYYKPYEYVEYKSVKKAVQKEELNILFPSVLPEKAAVDKVMVERDPSGKNVLCLFKDRSYSVSIQMDYTGRFSTERSTKVLCDGLEFYLFPDDYANDKYGAYMLYEGDYYVVCAETKEELLLMINSMSEK